MSYEQQQIKRLLDQIERQKKEISNLENKFNIAYDGLRTAYNYSNEDRVKLFVALALEKLEDK